METRLHSYETYLYKYLLPLMWIPWDGFRSLRRAFPLTYPNSATIIPLFIIIWCVTFPLVIWYALRLKTLVLTGNGLRIGGYFSVIEVPFLEVAGVKHNWFMKNDTLRLKVPSEFGDKILFIARGRVSTVSGRRSTFEILSGLIKES